MLNCLGGNKRMNYTNFSTPKDKQNIDYFIFLILIPSLLAIIFVLLHFHPQLKDAVILQPSNPTVISVYLSNYAHIEFRHFFENLVSYFLLISLIFRFGTMRNRFHLNLILIFTALPVLCSLSSIYYLSNLRSLGFSGIVSGLMGYLLYSVYYYVEKEWRIRLNKNFIFLIVVFNLSILSFIYKWIWLCVLLLLLLSVIACMIRNNLKLIIDKLNEIFVEWWKLKKSQKSAKFAFKFVIFALTVFFLLFGSTSLFPSNIITNGKITNILAHYVGYCFGVFVPLIPDFIVDIVSKIKALWEGRYDSGKDSV